MSLSGSYAIGGLTTRADGAATMMMRKPSACSAFSAEGVVSLTGSATATMPATAPSTTTNITVSPAAISRVTSSTAGVSWPG